MRSFLLFVPEPPKMNKDSKAMDNIQTILRQFKDDQNSEYADISDYDFALDRIYEVVTETGRTV